VIALPEKYVGPKIFHNDKLLVLARQVQRGRFEGTIRKINPSTAYRFKEYVHIISMPTQQDVL
jgi:hypothetical protein